MKLKKAADQVLERLELQIRKEDPFKQKLSKISFDSFRAKFRPNR